jgi:hypothetical protein
MAGSKLYLQVAEGHLRVVPKGYLTELGVKRILGATQAGLRVFPVVVVDLGEAREVSETILTHLEDGLRQIIAEKKQVLLSEPGKWTLQTFSPSMDDCRGHGDCSRCRGRSPKKQEVPKSRPGTG